MAWMMAAALGMNLLGGLSSYSAAKAQAKANKAWQAYSNTMARLSDAQNQNTITENEIASEAAFAEQAIGIDRAQILNEATAEAEAAAAGVKGRSVNQTLNDLNRGAAEAERQRQLELRNARWGFDQQRRNSAAGAANAQDYSYIPKPKFASYLLSTGSKMLGTYSRMSSV